MKFLIVASSLIAFSAFAMEGNLGEMQRNASDSIGREISSLQTSKTCVNGAKTIEAFKACNYNPEHMNMQKEEAVDKRVDKRVNDMKEDSMHKAKDLNKTIE